MSIASTLSSDVVRQVPCCSHDEEPKPWTSPLDLELLASSPVGESLSEVTTSDKREGYRLFIQLPFSQSSESSAGDSYDFDAQFRHVRSDFDEDEEIDEPMYECTPELVELIQQRVRKFETFARKHRKREIESCNTHRITDSGSSYEGSRHTVGRSKSFAQGLSCGVRSFLARPCKVHTAGDVPTRLNRLHGANESSMSGLSPTIRREFTKMSHLNNGSSRTQCQTHGKKHTITRRKEKVPENDLEHGRYLLGSQTYQNFLQNEQVASAGAHADFYENMAGLCTLPANSDHRLKCVERDNCEKPNQRRQVRWTDATTSNLNCSEYGPHNTNMREVVGPAAFDPKMPDSESGSGSGGSWNVKEEQKKHAFPLNVSDLIHQYNTGGTDQEDSGCHRDGDSESSFKMGLSYDIKSVRALFEKGYDEEAEVKSGEKRCIGQRPVSPITSRSALRWETDKGEINRFKPYSCYLNVDGGSSYSVAGSHDVSVRKPTLVETKGGHYTPLKTRDEFGVDKKLEGARSFLSSITPSASPSVTPPLGGKFEGPRSSDNGVFAMEEDVVTPIQEEDIITPVNGKGGKESVSREKSRIGKGVGWGRMNLKDLFDSMELSPGGAREGWDCKKTRGKMQSQGIDCESKVLKRICEDETMREESWNTERSKSFAVTKAGKNKGDGGRRRQSVATTRNEGGWNRTGGKVNRHGGRMRRKLDSIRNMVSADDY